MASAPIITPAPAQQPGLRSFIVYDRLPDGMAAWPVTDRSGLPHVRPGEFVVVDPSDCEPCEGELFLIQWKTGGEPRIARMDLRQHRNSNGPFEGWWIGDAAPKQLRNLQGEPVGEFARWADGPWPIEYAREIALGRVIGILEPSFEEPKRLIGENV